MPDTFWQMTPINVPFSSGCLWVNVFIVSSHLANLIDGTLHESRLLYENL